MRILPTICLNKKVNIHTCFAAKRLTSRAALSAVSPSPKTLEPAFTSIDTNASVCSITKEPPFDRATLINGVAYLKINLVEGQVRLTLS